MFHVSNKTRRRLLVLAGLAAMATPFAGDLLAQQAPAPPPAMLHQPTDARLQGFRWRSIGPTGQGGRIDDIAVEPGNPSTFYIGYAVSGLWKTVNNGTTFENIFAQYNHSIGDIAIAPSNANILYVGTGEPNNRQSSSFGDGMYKSVDAGKTWTHIGLRETQSIGRVVVHPKNPDMVWVAAVGHLYGPNEERGVFMTVDGGKSWTKSLYINQDTGATELVIDPSNPMVLFAATYERRRTSWGFVGGGPGSGIHQSVDGGKSWKKVTGGGLPRGTMGRIGLDFSRSNPNVIYAQIEVAADKEPAAPAAATPAPPAGGIQGGGGGGQGGRGGPQAPPDPTRDGVWRSADKGKTWTFQSNENQRPMYYSQIRVDPSNENYVFVGGVGPRKSLDGGKTWMNLNNMGHVDNHAIWINPANGRHVMYGNDGGLDVSYDQGETWESVRLQAVGLPYHVSVDMRRPYNVCTGLQDNGSWCGPSGQRSGDIYMWNWISVGGGDGFQTMVDPTDPNIFYTESQNGNINRYDLSTGQTTNIRPRVGGAGRGGGGGGQGGALGSNVMNELPADQLMQFNWNSPIRISPHNPSTILFGGRHFFVSRNRGNSWTISPVMGKAIDTSQRNILEQSYGSPGCGRGAGPGQRCILSRHDGYVANEYGTVTELEESPVVPGIYWVGTDDGNVQVSRDAGMTWTEVGKNLPVKNKETYISGIEASKYDAATAYVALDGHRDNDHSPYIYKTTDYGKTWTSIAGDLPRGNVNSIRQDPVAKNLLYAPTEYGFYISFNEGTNWMKFMPNIPNARVDEVTVHPRDNDLVLATHGYSIWIMDDITALQQMALSAPTAPTLFKPREAVQWKVDRMNQTEVPGSKYWTGENMPRGTAVSYYLPSTASDVLVKIWNTATGAEVRSCAGTGNVGLNRFQWTLTGNPAPGGGGIGRGGRGGGQPEAAPAQPTGPQPCNAPAAGGGRGGGGGFGGGGGGGIGPGVYRVTLTIAGKEVGSQTFNVLEDVWMKPGR